MSGAVDAARAPTSTPQRNARGPGKATNSAIAGTLRASDQRMTKRRPKRSARLPVPTAPIALARMMVVARGP